MKNRRFRHMLCAIISISLLLFCSAGFADNIDPSDDGSQYAWGENVGWLNLEADNDSGVEVGDDALTGYMWSENTGWINMAPVEGGVFNDGDGTLSGYAWGENVGWISFSCENTGNCGTAEYGVFIDPTTGEFSGYAWAENIGWINFYGVKTAWRAAPDADGDGVPDSEDKCPDVYNPGQEDSDNDGLGDVCEACWQDPDKTEPGICGCGVADTDADSDGTADCDDGCPDDPNKTEMGICGCGVTDTDSDGDGTADCNDGCSNDPNKTDPGQCGCGVVDTDYDADGIANCLDADDDNDGALDAVDSDDNNANVCSDMDGDTCDDCSSGTYALANDGVDFDMDGLCDAGDPDDDNDGVADGDDIAPFDNTQCRDVDSDSCDDCSSGTDAPANDGTDTDGDGLCDTGDSDDDNDGVADAGDTDSLDPDVCVDSDGDGCDDCAVGTDDFGPQSDNDPDNDGTDTDGDGLCDAGDPDGDGIHNVVDTQPNTDSSDFNDGTTTGTIWDPGDQLLTVTDAADPNKGVTIKADPAGGVTPATVRLCGGLSEISLTHGDETVETCGSIIVEVLNGTVEITFVADDGTSATTSLNAGNSLECDTETLTVTAPSTNTETAVILVDGEEISLDPGGTVSNIIVNLEKAKVSWDHGDIHLNGKLYLPEGIWKDTLNPVGSAKITLADIGVTDQDVEFEIKGKKGERWEYKDKKNLNGNIKELKIDWKEAKFDYHGDDGFHIHTHFIGGAETTLCIHTGRVSGDFTATINGGADENTIDYVYDAATKSFTINTDIGYEPQKDDNTHVHFSLPFALTSDLKIEVNESMEFTINVADHYKEGSAKFKLVGIFDSGFFPDGSGSYPDELKCVITLGEYTNMVLGNDLIGVEKGRTKKKDKH